MDYKTQFIKNLKEYRKQNNLTQDDLAEMLGYSQKNIAKWEQGFTLPSVDVMVELSKRMKISLDELLGLNEKSIFDKTIDFVIERQGLDRKQVCDDEGFTIEDVIYNQVFNIFFNYVNIILDDCKYTFKEYLIAHWTKEKGLAVDFLKEKGHVTEAEDNMTFSRELEIECFELYEKHLIDVINVSKKELEEWKELEKSQRLTKIDKEQFEACVETFESEKAELERFYESKEKYFANK
jgi:transcriptional regulator with XRE-family HTH domain